MNTAAWPCPKCGVDRAEWLGPIRDEEGFHVGDMLRCLGCEHFFEEVRYVGAASPGPATTE